MISWHFHALTRRFVHVFTHISAKIIFYLQIADPEAKKIILKPGMQACRRVCLVSTYYEGNLVPILPKKSCKSVNTSLKAGTSLPRPLMAQGPQGSI